MANSQQHKDKMARKSKQRDLNYRNQIGRIGMVGVPSRINRHTGKPHEHRREIARNVARKGVAA